jgi:hypothetical protein
MGTIWPLVSSGGLGVRHAVDSAIPCFFALVYSSGPLVQKLLPAPLLESESARKDREQAEKEWSLGGAGVLPPEEERGIQATWGGPNIALTLQQLTSEAATLADKARVIAGQQP